MEVVSTPLGFVLHFNSTEDMNQHVSNLQGQLEWIKEENIKPPYLYAVFDDNVSVEEVQRMLSRLKSRQ